MKIEIRIGNINNRSTRYRYESEEHSDDFMMDKARMYNILNNYRNCVIENVDVFLLVALNNGLLSHRVKYDFDGNDEKFLHIPQGSPEIYKAYEVYEDGTEKQLCDEDGCIGKNYFDVLMGKLMDDFYVSLNYLK